jgi:hypothetical protein
VRLRHYEHAISRWQSVADRKQVRLLVVETTDCAEELRRRLPSHTEVASFAPCAELRCRGKGAVEAGAIDHLFDTELASHADTETLYKCTGRLVVSNAQHLLASLPNWHVVGRATLDQSVLDTRFFGASMSVWRTNFRDAGCQVDDVAGRSLERVLASRVLIGLAANQLTFARFPKRPRYIGESGSTGQRYDRPAQALLTVTSWPLESLLRRLPATKQF